MHGNELKRIRWPSWLVLPVVGVAALVGITGGVATSVYGIEAANSANSKADSDFYSADLSQIRKRGEIVVSINGEDHPPFLYHNPAGELTGIDIELVNYIAQQLGVKVRYTATARIFQDVLTPVVKNEADIAISALYPTVERATSLYFSVPYFHVNRIMLVNRVKAAKLKLALNDLTELNRSDVSIGSYDLEPFTDRIQNLFPKATTRKFQHHIGQGKEVEARKTFLGDLTSGKLVAAYIDSIEAGKWHELSRSLDLWAKPIADSGSDSRTPIVIAVNHQKSHLVSWLNVIIQNLKANGTLQKMSAPHLSQRMGREAE